MDHNFSTPELRKKHSDFYKAYFKAVDRGTQRPSFPDECMGMACGAKTRTGTPCKLTSLYVNGRCKYHGGLSTGPKTIEGKRRSAMNGFKQKKKTKPMWC